MVSFYIFLLLVFLTFIFLFHLTFFFSILFASSHWSPSSCYAFLFFFFYFIFSLYFFFPSLSTTTSLVDSHSCKNFHQSEFQIAMFHNPHRTLQSLLCIFIYMYVVFKVLTPLDSFENYGDSSKRTHKNIAKKKINKYIFL